MSWWDRLRGREPAPLVGSEAFTDAMVAMAVDALAKAQSLEPKGKAPEPQAHDIDPWDVYAAVGDEGMLGQQHLGTAGLDYTTLMSMARVPTIAGIIQTRVNQIGEFAWPAYEEGSLGFQMRLRDREKTPTKAQQKRIHELTDWMVSCGDERIGFELNMESFLRMLMRDSLTYDQATFEVVRTKGKDVAGFVLVDASTVRRAIPTEEERDAGIRRKDDQIAFVQILGDEVVAEWTARDLAFCVRRPRSAIAIQGYGYPELEDLIRVITSILHGETYNANNFTHGMHTAGILALKSKMNPKMFRAFRREFYALMSGAYNAKKTPIVQLDPDAKEELQAINLSQSNRDMEFKEWMAYLQKVACSIYQIDPAELGFVHGAENQTGALSQGGPEARITASKEKGLRPLLRGAQVWLNRWVVSQVDPDFELVFVGLDKARQDAQFEADLKRLKGFMTPNEIRARYDLKPIPPEVDGGAADMILDSSYMNTAMQLRQMAQMDEEGGEEPGGGGGEEQGDESQGEEPGEETDASQGWDMDDDDVDLDALFGGPQGDEPDDDDDDDEDEDEDDDDDDEDKVKKALVEV